ncbi:MAG TPA: amidohydrolase family protein, partial [Mycobacterium sp.]|nr:amidohydrolase family protein [Mycobacterium sp.]
MVILTASSIITMDPARPRAEAVAVDPDSGAILAVGSLAECRAAAPGATVEDLGGGVLMPGFIQAHDHPVPAAVLCQLPAHWIAPFVGFPTWDDVEALFDRLRRQTPVGQPLLFNGLDRLLLSIPMPDRASLDRYFPDHPVLIFDITGHALYFNSRATGLFGWTNATPPADTPDARW